MIRVAERAAETACAHLEEATVFAEALRDGVAGDAREGFIGVDERHVGLAAVSDGDALLGVVHGPVLEPQQLKCLPADGDTTPGRLLLLRLLPMFPAV